MIQICTRHLLFACVLKRNGKKKKKRKEVNSFRFSFCNLKGCFLFIIVSSLSLHISSTIDIFVKNQKRIEKEKER
jgi:hypothetical protein